MFQISIKNITALFTYLFIKKNESALLRHLNCCSYLGIYIIYQNILFLSYQRDIPHNRSTTTCLVDSN